MKRQWLIFIVIALTAEVVTSWSQKFIGLISDGPPCRNFRWATLVLSELIRSHYSTPDYLAPTFLYLNLSLVDPEALVYQVARPNRSAEDVTRRPTLIGLA